MSILPRRTSLIGAVLLALFLAGRAQALVLDWDNAAWAPGSLINAYDLNGDTLNDITVTVTSQQANIWRIDSTSGEQTPTVNQTLTGGLSQPQNSLMLAADLHTNSNATVQLSFTGGTAGNLPGATNVSFTLFDIDLSADRDTITNIYGLAPDGSHVAATITNVGANVILSGIGLGQQLTSNVVTANNSGDGNATISFGSSLIYSVFFTFGNSSGPPRYQDIGIGNITFTPVPEINPTAASAVSCAVAVGLTVWMRRRKQKAGLPSPTGLKP